MCKRPARPLPKLTSLALGRTDAIFYMVGSWGDETISGAVMVAAMLTVVSVVWLVASHTKPSQIGDEAKCKPKMVERYFVAGAAAFIVGWGWVLVVDAIIRSISAAFGSSWEVEMVLVALFGPGLALFLLQAQFLTSDKYNKMAHGHITSKIYVSK